MVVKKQEVLQWHILRSFVFGKKTYNIGEKVPNFMSKKDKEGLYKQGRIAKISPDGNLQKFDLAVDFNPQDLQNIANNPQLIVYIVGEYTLYKEDLEVILETVKLRVYAREYEKLITDKMKTAPIKNKEKTQNENS